MTYRKIVIDVSTDDEDVLKQIDSGRFRIMKDAIAVEVTDENNEVTFHLPDMRVGQGIVLTASAETSHDPSVTSSGDCEVTAHKV